MATETEFSVIVPSYNYAHFLRDSIGSVLSQEAVTFEVIVVDDGSTDNSFEIVQEFDNLCIRYIKTPHAGIGAARNRGVLEATGVYLAFLDADDTWRSDRLLKAKGRISRLPSPSLSFAMVQEFLDSSIDTLQGTPPLLRVMPGIYASTCVVRREVFDAIGPFDEGLKSGEFIDWYIRAQRQGVHTDIDPAVLVFRRVHQHNRDRLSRASSKDYARILLRKIRASKDS